MNIQIRPAQLSHFEEVVQFLHKVKLPTEDLSENSLAGFILAFDNSHLIGTAGIEYHNKYALLRSVAIDETQRNKKIAEALTKQILLEAESKGVCEVFLITNTADQYFEKQGFITVERVNVPIEIVTTQQFSTICPSSAVVMKKALTQ